MADPHELAADKLGELADKMATLGAKTYAHWLVLVADHLQSDWHYTREQAERWIGRYQCMLLFADYEKGMKPADAAEELDEHLRDLAEERMS